MIRNDIEQIMKESFDYSNLDNISYLSEASNQDKMLVALTSRLYDMIRDKADKIDYSSVSRSRGDITKIENYNSLVECINIMRQIVLKYKEDTIPLDIINSAMENLRSRTTEFKKAFAFNTPILVMTYNNIAMAIVSSVSFLIATCIEYIKIPGKESFETALNVVGYRDSMSNLLFESLASFNEGCKSGEFDKLMEVAFEKRIKESTVVIRHDGPYMSDEDIESDNNEVVVHDDNERVQQEFSLSDIGNTIMGGIEGISFGVSRAFVFCFKFLIPLIRGIVYHFYSWKQKKHDYYETQAELIEANALELRYNEFVDESRKAAIIKKQMQIATNFKLKANRWSIENKKTRKETAKMIKDEVKKFNVDDLLPKNNPETGEQEYNYSLIF